MADNPITRGGLRGLGSPVYVYLWKDLMIIHFGLGIQIHDSSLIMLPR